MSATKAKGRQIFVSEVPLEMVNLIESVFVHLAKVDSAAFAELLPSEPESNAGPVPAWSIDNFYQAVDTLGTHGYKLALVRDTPAS